MLHNAIKWIRGAKWENNVLARCWFIFYSLTNSSIYKINKDYRRLSSIWKVWMTCDKPVFHPQITKLFFSEKITLVHFLARVWTCNNVEKYRQLLSLFRLGTEFKLFAPHFSYGRWAAAHSGKFSLSKCDILEMDLNVWHAPDFKIETVRPNKGIKSSESVRSVRRCLALHSFSRFTKFYFNRYISALLILIAIWHFIYTENWWYILHCNENENILVRNFRRWNNMKRHWLQMATRRNNWKKSNFW